MIHDYSGDVRKLCALACELDEAGQDVIAVCAVLSRIISHARNSEAIKQAAKVHPLACCWRAVRQDCVCSDSFKCPVHGQQCHGTHD